MVKNENEYVTGYHGWIYIYSIECKCTSVMREKIRIMSKYTDIYDRPANSMVP